MLLPARGAVASAQNPRVAGDEASAARETECAAAVMRRRAASVSLSSEDPCRLTQLKTHNPITTS